ncbi:hypothetical protein RMATCC62417_07858 [Rhizopus microsporus]|nr:hypothetical protein RMATCC62417_07858 [Rhizopus microsporus]
MVRVYAIAFRSANTALSHQTRVATLGLYRSLLRASEKYEQHSVISNAIREQFKANRHVTSRPRVLELLEQANKIHTHLQKADPHTTERVTQYAADHFKKRHPPQKKKSKKRNFRRRKPYQKPILVTHWTGYQFYRVRGWRQPLRTSMIIKNLVKRQQRRQDLYAELAAQYEMVQKEFQFEKQLGMKQSYHWLQTLNLIKEAMNRCHKRNLKTKTIDPVKKNMILHGEELSQEDLETGNVVSLRRKMKNQNLRHKKIVEKSKTSSAGK